MREQQFYDLCEKVYLEVYHTPEFLRKTINRCLGFLENLGVNFQFIDRSEWFTIDLTHNIKKAIELLGYCYYSLREKRLALEICLFLIISDDSGFCPYDELSFSYENFELFYNDLEKSTAKILKMRKDAKETIQEPEFYRELADEYFFLGYYCHSIKWYEIYLQKHPKESFEYWQILAELYMFQKKFQKALICYKNAIKIALNQGYRNEIAYYEGEIKKIKKKLNRSNH